MNDTTLPDQITIDGILYEKKKDLIDTLKEWGFKQCQNAICLNIIHESKTYCLDCVQNGKLKEQSTKVVQCNTCQAYIKLATNVLQCGVCGLMKMEVNLFI